MISALAAIGGGGTLLFGVAFIVLTFKSRGDVRELIAAGDLLDAEHKKSDVLTAERDLARGDLAATKKKLEQEQQLRIAVEAQRDNGEAAYIELLTKNSEGMTNEQLTALTKKAFSVPLSLVPGNELVRPE